MTLIKGFAGLMAIFALFFLGCQHIEQHAENQEASNQASTAAFPFNLEAATMLAKADAVDGSEDHVVSKCGGCALGMDGSHDHSLKVGDYEMQFCSEYCKGTFEKDTEASVMGLTIPEVAN